MNVSTKRASIAAASTVVAAGLIVGGVASTSDAATPAPAATAVTKTVTISGMRFQPSILKIKVGTKVKWVNHDGMAHTVTWNGKYGFTNRILAPGQSTPVITFSKAGTFSYHCAYHPMAGSVVVSK